LRKDEPSLAVCCKDTRESNPEAGLCNQCDGLRLEHRESSRAAPAQHLADTEGHFLALNGSPSGALLPCVQGIAAAWAVLQPHIREAILTLVDAAMASSTSQPSPNNSTTLSSVEALAWRMAHQCREVVQGCLREEEWADADHEFFCIISEGMSDRG
jgi:hypothetical protein